MGLQPVLSVNESGDQMSTYSILVTKTTIEEREIFIDAPGKDYALEIANEDNFFLIARGTEWSTTSQNYEVSQWAVRIKD